MIYTSANQVSAVVPFRRRRQDHHRGAHRVQRRAERRRPVSVADSAPALFTANASGTGQIAALNQDGSINSPSNPPSPPPVVLYATGGGAWTESIPDGQITGSHLVAPKAPVYARVGKLPARSLRGYGAQPGQRRAADQHPAPQGTDRRSGLPIQISVGSYTSPPGTTLAVK